MTTECNAREFAFQGLGSRAVTARFDGGAITSDAGGLLLREVEAKTGILRRFAACFADHRDPDRVEHSVGELIAQRVFALALGYEDLNDHDTLRHDPLLAILVGKADPTGQDRRRKEDRGKSLAGKSTLNRLELTPVGADKKSRYKKIVARHHDIDSFFVETFLALHRTPPKEIILDLDATDDPIHGHQLGRFFHGYYDGYCYLPLYIFCGEHLLCAKLRPADIDGAAGSVKQVARIVEQIRHAWPDVRIIVRGDSGFCREPLMCWCEAHQVHYVLGLAKNTRLQRILGKELHEAKLQFAATGQASRVFKDFTYQTRKSWSRARSRGGQGRTLGQGEQSAIRRDVAFAGGTRRPRLVRGPVLCPRRNGEPDQGAAIVFVRRPHQLRDDACQPIAAVVVERGLHAVGSVATVRTARHRDGSGTLRHDPVAAVEVGGIGAYDSSSGVDFVFGELSVSARVCPGLREPVPVVVAVAGIGITVIGP